MTTKYKRCKYCYYRISNHPKPRPDTEDGCFCFDMVSDDHCNHPKPRPDCFCFDMAGIDEIEREQKELADRSMEWIPYDMHAPHPHNEWVIVKLKSGIRRYAFARFETGSGWYDENNHSIREIECYAKLKDPIFSAVN